MKSSKSPLKKAKEKAWAQFSIYIRTRDCLRFTGDKDSGMCVTCKRPFPFKNLQAGHFIQGRSGSILFDERIVYSQCAHCNLNPPRGLGGNYVEYFAFMEEEWGREMIEEFRQLKHETLKYKIFDYERVEEEYKSRVQELLLSLVR